jgi:hypothetical protein
MTAERPIETTPEALIGSNGHDPFGRDPAFDPAFESGSERIPDTEAIEANLEAIRQRFPRLDWHALWADEETSEEYIHNPLLPARRAVAIFSPPKAGKSLLLLEMAVTLSRGEDSSVINPHGAIGYCTSISRMIRVAMCGAGYRQ